MMGIAQEFDITGPINLDISASDVHYPIDNGLSEASNGPKSKYSELLRRKNMRNQQLVQN